MKKEVYDEEHKRYLYESLERMKNPFYVEKLVYYGYKVPEKYRKYCPAENMPVSFYLRDAYEEFEVRS